jgi:TolA-binding protein
MGEAYYAQRQFEPAIKEYNKLLKNYPDSGKASHALLKIGYSYDELDDKTQAEGQLEELISRYPGTSAASLAQQRLDHIRSE